MSGRVTLSLLKSLRQREDSRWYFEVSGLTTGKSRREYYTTLSIW